MQEEYRKEGVDVSDVQFTDNRCVLDLLLAKPVGILALLDEESNFPKATDNSLVRECAAPAYLLKMAMMLNTVMQTT